MALSAYPNILMSCDCQLLICENRPCHAGQHHRLAPLATDPDKAPIAMGQLRELLPAAWTAQVMKLLIQVISLLFPHA